MRQKRILTPLFHLTSYVTLRKSCYNPPPVTSASLKNGDHNAGLLYRLNGLMRVLLSRLTPSAWIHICGILLVFPLTHFNLTCPLIKNKSYILLLRLLCIQKNPESLRTLLSESHPHLILCTMATFPKRPRPS